jgi:hypothetical protein
LFVEGVDLFNSCKLVFAEACNEFVSNIEKEVMKQHVKKIVVVHVDEAQVVIGRVLVTRNMMPSKWIDDTAALRSFAFPCLCDSLNVLANKFQNVLVVITGTNAFSSLVLNTGSQLKVQHVALVGRFEVDWVMRELVGPHFGQLSDEIEKAVREQLTSLCANRRACWFLCRSCGRRVSVCH